MTDLADFLLARISEDEAVARQATEGPWTSSNTYTQEVCVDAPPWTVVAHMLRTDADHIARHDPARVLAECDAKRRIVEQFGAFRAGNALRLLALPYADHEDYREEWRP